MTEQQKEQKAKFGVKYAKWIVKNKWITLLGALALAFVMMPKGPPQFNNDYQVFFSDENPQLKSFLALQAKYTKDDNVYVIFEPKSGKVFERDVLLAIEEFTDTAWQTPYSSRVDAITNYQHTVAEGDDMYVDDLLYDVSSKTDQEIKEAEKVALAEPLLMKRLINEDGSFTGVNITVKTPSAEEWVAIQKARAVSEDSVQLAMSKFMAPEEEVAAFVRKKVAELEEKHPSITTHLSGVVMLSNAFGEAANKDMQTLFPLMFLAIIIVLMISSRSVTGTFATLIVLLFSIMSAMGFAGMMGIKFTAASMPNAPIMILTLAVADSIHILISFVLSMRKGLNKKEAIIESMRINFMPVFITSATTVLGFLTLNFSDSPPFRDLGNISAVGVAMAFIYSITILPALLAILPVRIKARELGKTDSPYMNKLADLVIEKQKPILWGSMAIIIAFIFFASKNELNEQFVEYFDESIEFRADTDLMSEEITGIYTVEFSVGSSEEGGISQPEYLKTLSEFEEWFEEQEGVIHVNTYTDVARKVNKSMHGDDENYYTVPTSREEAAQYLLLYEMSLPFGLDLNNQINVDKSETRFIVTIENITAKEIIKIGDMGERWLDEHGIKGESNVGTSTAIMFAHLTQRQIYSMAEGGIWALILISIVLTLALRNTRIGLISVVPNVIPMVMAFGAWYFISGYITSGLAIVFSVTIGIVVDDTVHLLSKYLRAIRENNATPEEAIRYSFTTVGRAIIMTTVVLGCGFFILGQSSFKMMSGMASLTAITIVFALIIDLLFLPALLLALHKINTNHETNEFKSSFNEKKETNENNAN